MGQILSSESGRQKLPVSKDIPLQRWRTCEDPAMAEAPEKTAKPDLYVVARFLEKLITTGGSRRKTDLQMAVGLNFNVYAKYLDWLENKELIRTVEEDERLKRVFLTSKGMDTYKTLVKWIKDTVGPP